ncbi:MAG: DUF2019 domain-containing protein [Xanthobacteraceae bacterium]
MKNVALHKMTGEQLVDRFAALALAQDEALLMDEIAKVNRLYDQLEAVEAELKSRPGDQRRILLALYEHPNAQVRVKAIKATLAVVPEQARSALKALADSKDFPQAGEAGMCIYALEEGIYKPT